MTGKIFSTLNPGGAIFGKFASNCIDLALFRFGTPAKASENDSEALFMPLLSLRFHAPEPVINHVGDEAPRMPEIPFVPG